MLLLCDSICVKILSKNVVLAGVGNELRVYTNIKNAPPQTLQWKLKNKIHGIEFDRGRTSILVFGEREFMVLTYNGEKFELLCRGKISDWISSAKLLDDALNRICLITGHSVALGLSICPAKTSCSIESRSSCVDKSTVYCSLVVGNSTTNCTVLAGTAFGELIIWQPSFGNRNIEECLRRPILHRIAGHNGIIFSIDVNIPLGLITTTSDDRSVRFWCITKNESHDEKPFNWRNIKIIPHHSVYGHNARVFKAKIISQDDNSYVISVGEDSYVCVWNTNGELLFKRRHHFGATVWDFDYDCLTKVLFSTSSDGNMISYHLGDSVRTIRPEEIKTETLNSEYLSKVKFVTKDFLIAVTNRNKLIYRPPNSDWKIVNGFSEYKCTLLEVFENLIAIAGYKVITLYKLTSEDSLTKIFEMEILSNIVRSFCFLSKNEFLICDDKGECKYSQDNFQTTINIDIPSSKERWITAALKHDAHLIISNRQGHIFLYSLENNEFKLTSTIKHLHGYLGVTNINLESNCNDRFSVKTAGHDSTMKTLKIDKTTKKIAVVLTESIPISWIERVYKTANHNKYIVGFNDNHFVVWEPKHDVVFQISCGGGHRCWDLILDEANNLVELIFIKNKQLYSASSVLDKNRENQLNIPYFAWHMKPCNVLKSFHGKNSELVLISGSEDNLLKFSKYSIHKSTEIDLIANMSLHVSSIKSVAVTSKTNENKFLVFSAGGRAQICVAEFDLNNEIVEERINFMLKSNDFDRKFQRNTREIDFDPETRFMSIEAIQRENCHDLYLGCSDGYIRKFIYRNDSIESDEKIFYDKCILHVKIIVRSDDQFYLLTAATDGLICFWNLNSFNESSKAFLKIKHHNSGINSLDIQIKDDLLFIVTGGDDQNVTFSKLRIIEDNFEMIITKNFPFLHTAQVNGVKFSPCSSYFYTTSIDQSICKIDLNSLEFDRMIVTAVADTKGLEVFAIDDRNYCIVYGSGIQIVEL